MATAVDRASSGRRKSLAVAFAWLFEALGVLNQGSSRAPASPSPEEAARTVGVSTNTLNVTRVLGLGALITGTGAAALGLFAVDKKTDAASVVVAAYASVGVIVAAALLTAAIIVSADIRARVAVNAPSALTALGRRSAVQGGVSAGVSDTTEFVAAWHDALDVLRGALKESEQYVDDQLTAWLDACASTHRTAQLQPAEEQRAMHARLQAGQRLVLGRFESLIGEEDARARMRSRAEIAYVLEAMDRSIHLLKV
ncbi:hypothetical protein ACIRP3_11455 [Streptomyces sp. NPDC101209]|uniref:hypothetical protein n=1 Tax=Streptomyces sp. NPDC101209 TaxID=3366129 RepID=UPI003800D258